MWPAAIVRRMARSFHQSWERGRRFCEKTLRVGEAEVERDEAAEGGAAERRVGGVGEGAELAIDAGLQLFDEEPAVEIAVAAAKGGVAGGCVLGHAAKAGVVDADEDDGFDEASAGEAVGGGVGLPGVVGDVRGAAVEEVLAVVEIEDRKMARGLVDVGFRQVDFDVASVRQEARLELPEDEVARIVVELVRGRESVVRTWSGFERREGCGCTRRGRVEGDEVARICGGVEGQIDEVFLDADWTAG